MIYFLIMAKRKFKRKCAGKELTAISSNNNNNRTYKQNGAKIKIFKAYNQIVGLEV